MEPAGIPNRTSIINDLREAAARAVLEPHEWQRRQEEHTAAISAVVDPWLEGRRRQKKDPVLDFLFEYYRFRPARLKRWSPGFGTGLRAGGKRPLRSDRTAGPH